jgi:phosphoribosylglycinamide formyltransferase 1
MAGDAKARIAILISGRGSNMVALADAVAEERIAGAEVAIVISDQAHAAGLESARQRGIESAVIQRLGRSREDHDREIVAELKRRNVDLVCLAGYMRILSQVFLDSYRGRILNIHPSLLPAFPGLNPQKQALDQGAQTAGCTVHLVDETLDGGPIIAQRRVPILPGDTVESLSARILEQEHRLYPEAVALVLREAQFSSAAQT